MLGPVHGCQGACEAQRGSAQLPCGMGAAERWGTCSITKSRIRPVFRKVQKEGARSTGRAQSCGTMVAWGSAEPVGSGDVPRRETPPWGSGGTKPKGGRAAGDSAPGGARGAPILRRAPRDGAAP